MSNEKRLSRGNLKLSKDVGIFNLPAVDSCLNCEDCSLTCYAKIAEKMYPNVRNFRNTNYELAKHDKATLCKLISAQIEKENIKIVRIHESGDFFEDDYVDMWEAIVIMFPEVKFYGYSKCFDILDIDKLNAYGNCNIINSFINGKRNYGSEEYVKQLGAFICPTEGCMSTCKECLTVDKVAFVIHGSAKGKDTYEESQEYAVL